MDGVWNRPGFVNKPNHKGIEYLVDSYLKLITSGARLRQERKYLEKAIILINKILGHPCCDEGASIIDFGTPYENQITTSLKNILFGGEIVRRSFRPSLFRMLDKLNIYLYGCCTQVLTVNFASSSQDDITVNFTDVVTGNVLFSTTTIGGAAQTITLPAKYFGPGSLIKVCVNQLSAGTFIVSDGTTNIITSTTTGTLCSTTIESLKSTYSVTG